MTDRAELEADIAELKALRRISPEGCWQVLSRAIARLRRDLRVLRRPADPDRSDDRRRGVQ